VGALRALDQYERAAGPVLPQGSPAPKLIRECGEQVEQARGAAAAARQMQAEAQKKAAEAAAGSGAAKAATPPAATGGEGPKPGDIAPRPVPKPAPRPTP
jgi:hypothetical protein